MRTVEVFRPSSLVTRVKAKPEDKSPVALIPGKNVLEDSIVEELLKDPVFQGWKKEGWVKVYKAKGN